MQASISRGELFKVAFGASVGTTIEWYDFFIAATAASLVFPRILFPPQVDPGLALIYSLATTLLVGFLSRPIGALVFGHLGDRLGRKTALVWNLVLMGIGTLGMGLIPDYAAAGYLGLWLVLVFRFLQGLGVGGEWGGVATWLTEQAYAAGSRWRAFWASWVQQGVPIGLMWASGTFAVLSALYPGQAFLQWGWRMAFYIGAAVIVVGVVIRYLLLESVLFEVLKRTAGVARAPSIEVWRAAWKTILLGALPFATINGPGYIFISYSVAYITGLGMERGLALLSQTAASLAAVFVIIAFATLGDRIGRKRIMTSMFLLGIPVGVAYPLMLMTKQAALVVLAQTVLWAFVIMGAYSVLAAFLAEHFPTRYRFSGAGLAYSIGAVLGGGLAPIFTAAIVGTAYAERWWGVSLVLVAYSVLGLLALLALKETKEAKLEH